MNRTALLAGHDELLKVEAYLLDKEFGSKFDVSAASLSILAKPAVAVVDRNVDRKGTRAVAGEYLKYLYSDLIWLVMQPLSCQVGGPPMA